MRLAVVFLALLTGVSVARAGYPGVAIFVLTEDSCPVDVPAYSALDATDGALRLEYPFASVSGPGQPVVFTLYYSSAADNPQTHGQQLRMLVRTEAMMDPSARWHPARVTRAEIAFPQDQGGSESRVGFGKTPGDDSACNESRTGPVAFDNTSPKRKAQANNPAGWCGDAEYQHATLTAETETVLTFSVNAARNPQTGLGTQGSYQRIQSGGSCDPSQVITIPRRGVMTVRGGADVEYAHGDVLDHGYDCEQQVYLRSADDDAETARMGTNWTHSFAWRIRKEVLGDGSRMLVLLAPGGGHAMFRVHADTPTIGDRYPPYPDRLGNCACGDGVLYFTQRASLTPSFVDPPSPPPEQPIPFKTWELLRRDGSRMVFTAEPTGPIPAGSLVRIEENSGRNPTTLHYDSGGRLDKITDAAGFEVTLTYAGTGSEERLMTIEFPGGRTVKLDYVDGKLTSLRDPVQSADQGLPHHTFQYGTGPLDSADITCRTSPDGETHRYAYYPGDPPGTSTGVAGRLLRAELVNACADAQPVSAFTYTYSQPDTLSDPPSPEDAQRWVRVAPSAPASAPTLHYVLDASGQVMRIHEICTQNCPIVESIHPTDPVIEVVTAFRRDEWGKVRATRRYPVVQGLGGPRRSLEQSHFSVTCADRTRVGSDLPPGVPLGVVKEAIGPTCHDPSQPARTFSDWGDVDCDCELKAVGLSPVGAPVGVGPELTWTQTDVSAKPTWLPSGKMDRLLQATAPSQRSNFGNPGATGASARFFYYTSADDPDCGRDGLVSDICPAHVTTPEPGLGCDHYDYDVVPTGSNECVVRLQSMTDGAGATWTWAYHPNHLLRSITGPESDGLQISTQFTHDARGFVETLTTTGGLETAIARNARGQATLVTRPGAEGSETFTTQFNYSPAGRLRLTIDTSRPAPGQPGKSAAWAQLYGGPEALNGATGTTRASRLPYMLRRITVTAPAQDAVLSASAPLPDEYLAVPHFRLSHDANGAPTVSLAGRGSSLRQVLMSYDGFGNPRQNLVINGRLLGQSPNPSTLPEGPSNPEQFCIVTDPLIGAPVRVEQAFHAEDPPTCGGPGNQIVQVFRHDRAGRLINAETSWDLGVGQAGAQVSCMSFDKWGRAAHAREEVHDVAGPCVGAPTAARDVLFELHDQSDRLEAWIREESSPPWVDSVRYLLLRDEAGRPSLLQSNPGVWGEQPAQRYRYRPDGLLRGLSRTAPLPPCGGIGEPPCPPWPLLSADCTFEYDGRAFVKRVTATSQGMHPEVITDGIYHYSHDNAGRLTEARRDSFNQSPGLGDVFHFTYGYQPTNPSNLYSVTDVRASMTRLFPVDAHDRLTLPGHDYDDDLGALWIEPRAGAPAREYRWDTAGRLLAALDGDAGTRYVYDAFDRLLAREPVTRDPVTQELSSAGNVTMHLWSGWSQAGELELDAGDPDRQPEHTWLEGPRGVTDVFYNDAGGKLSLFADHQRSVKTAWEDNPVYEPFGEIARGSLSVSKGFQNQEWRDEAGLYYMRHRWYDPQSKRFLSRDPVIGSDVTEYAFVRNGPVMAWDPMGEAAVGSVGVRMNAAGTLDVYLVVSEGLTLMDTDDIILTYGPGQGQDLVKTLLGGPDDPYAGFVPIHIVPPWGLAVGAPAEWQARIDKRAAEFAARCPTWTGPPCYMQCYDMVQELAGTPRTYPQPMVPPWDPYKHVPTGATLWLMTAGREPYIPRGGPLPRAE